MARLLTHLDIAPAAAFGSSGGAVTLLALAEARADLVHTVVAHEPPLDEMLPDREERRAVAERIVATYLEHGRAAAWRLFLADANIDLPEPVFAEMFGRPLELQPAADEDYFFRHEMQPASNSGPTLTPCGRGERGGGHR